jgi:hypothetical protein
MASDDAYEALRRDVRAMFADLTSLLAKRPPTPASVHALDQQADRERQGFAWLHHCGHLNHGYWDDRSVCGGCRFSVEKAGHVDAHYRLVPVEGLSDEEQG